MDQGRVQVSGSVVLDVSGQGNNGTTAGTTIVEGLFGQSRSFSGNDTLPLNFVAVPDSPSLDVTGALTIDAWIKPGNKNGQIASKWRASIGDASYTLNYRASTGGHIGFAVSQFGGGGSATLLFSNSVVPPNDVPWPRITGTYEPSTAMKIHIDGVEDAALTVGVPPSIDDRRF